MYLWTCMYLCFHKNIFVINICVACCFFFFISITSTFLFQSNQNLTKTQRKKLHQKAKKQQKLLQKQMEAAEKEAKQATDVSYLLSHIILKYGLNNVADK